MGISDRESWLLREAFPTGRATGWRRTGCLAMLIAAAVLIVVGALIGLFSNRADSDRSGSPSVVECELPAPSGAEDDSGAFLVGEEEFEILDAGRNEAANACSQDLLAAEERVCEVQGPGSGSAEVKLRVVDFDGHTAESTEYFGC